ncbi:PREDICTED: choline/ethanolamine kinase isoform X2 [Papilio polytes]|uniref:choline/ethanolamine kinase isoform X2 n=1 Tax=Papilio polytes TaxID=76194 RepID=UPI0006761588|nr:PREDICTED: choline/ethanolamine kinase isoform X2 [Papilio polytes]
MSSTIKKIFMEAGNYCNRLILSTRSSFWKLQMCGTEEEMREVAGKICRNYLHGAWKSVKPKELVFRRISGGLSNFLYYVALPENATKLGGGYLMRETSPDTEPDAAGIKFPGKSMGRIGSFSIEEPTKVLLRIYGQVHGERAMDAIVTESVIFTLLSERRLGPKLHGVFSGGRIEEYIPARPLLTRELAEPALSMKIAEKMAAIHSMDVPLSKEPNWLWKTMAKWLRTVRSERLTKYAVGKNEDEEEIIKRLKTVDFENEIEWLKKFIETIESPVVFCHNDLQEGNILLLEDLQTNTDDEETTDYVQTYNVSQEKQEKHARLEPLAQFEDTSTSDSVISHISDSGEPKLVLIDFEYCAYNYRGFDIANHLQEWAYDYTNPQTPFYFENQENWPNLEQKEIFIKEYLKHYFTSPSEEKEPSIDDINQLLTEVEAFALASHLFWSLWSIVNASKSQIPFGYWEYGLTRVETYLRLKQEVIKKEKFGFPQKRKICEVDI